MTAVILAVDEPSMCFEFRDENERKKLFAATKSKTQFSHTNANNQ